MKVYMIYRMRSDEEMESLKSSSENTRIKRKELYAFSALKQFATDFMKIHSNKRFVMVRKKFHNDEYEKLVDDHYEKELHQVEMKDRTHKILISATEDEETDMETMYYDEIVSALPGIASAIPSCRIFTTKYQKVLDFLGISKSVYKSRVCNTDDSTADYDIEIDSYDSGECGYNSPGMAMNSLNIYVKLYENMLKKGKKK